MVATVNITGNVRLPDNSVPRNADIVFTLNAPIASFAVEAVIPAQVVAPIASGGAIDVSIAANIGAYHSTRYRMTVIEYVAPDKQVEWRRHDLGMAKITTATTIGTLVPVDVNTRPYSPIVIRKGDTISMGLQSLNDEGARQDLSGVTIRAMMKHAQTGVVVPLAVDNIQPLQGLYRVYLADTSTLFVGNYLWNLSFSANGEKTSTDFKELRIVEALA